MVIVVTALDARTMLHEDVWPLNLKPSSRICSCSAELGEIRFPPDFPAGSHSQEYVLYMHRRGVSHLLNRR